MTFNPLTPVLVGWVAAAMLMALLWLVQRVGRNAAIADVGWCFGLGFVVIGYALVILVNIALLVLLLYRLCCAVLVALYRMR